MTSIPVMLLTGADGASKSTRLHQLLSRNDDARTLVIQYGPGTPLLEHGLLAHAMDDTGAAARPVCACCLPGQTLTKVLVDAPWRFSRQGRRLFDRVVVVCAEQTNPARLAAALQDDKRLAQRYRLADIISDTQELAEGQVRRPLCNRVHS